MASILSRLNRFLRLGHRWQRVAFAWRVCLRDPNLYPLHRSPLFDADLCARMFVRNQDAIRRYLRSIGAGAVTYLQPANGLGMQPLTYHDHHAIAHLRRRVTADGLDQVEALARVYAKITSDPAFRRDPDCLDLSGIFATAAGPIFVDQVHCSDRGYDLIARRIAEDLLQRDEQPEKNTAVCRDSD